MVSNKYQQIERLDRCIFSGFCSSFTAVQWTFDYTVDEYAGYDAMATAVTNNNVTTYDVEIKSVFLRKFLDHCIFEPDKWLSLVGGENDVCIYFVIYPLLNKIAIWRVNRALLEASPKDFKECNRNTLRGAEKCLKHVYLFPISKAKVYDVDLSQYRDKYNAIYIQAS